MTFASRLADHWIIRTIRGALSNSPIASDPDVQDATRFKEDVAPTEGTDYGWAYDYARSDFERLAAIGKELDDKANDIIKYLGGGTGLFTIAALMSASPDRLHILAWGFPSFVGAVTAIIFAALARQPNETYVPPEGGAAFRYVEHFKDSEQAKGAFIGQWNKAAVGVAVANERKADRVAVATWAFVFAIVFLGLPLLAAVYGF